MQKYQIQQKVYFIRSNLEVVEGTIIDVGCGFYTVTYANGFNMAGARLKAHRLFPEKSMAIAELRRRKPL